MKQGKALNLFILACLFLNLVSPAFAAVPPDTTATGTTTTTTAPTAEPRARLNVIDDATAKVFRNTFRSDAEAAGLSNVDYFANTNIKDHIGQATGIAIGSPSDGVFYHRRDAMYKEDGDSSQSAGAVDTFLRVAGDAVVYEQTIAVALADAAPCLQFNVRVVTKVDGLAKELESLAGLPDTYQAQQVQTLMAADGEVVESIVTVNNQLGETYSYDPRSFSEFDEANVMAVAAASCGNGCLIDCIKKHLGDIGALEIICIGAGTIGCAVVCASPAAPACPLCIGEVITVCTGAVAAAGLLACAIECLFG